MKCGIFYARENTDNYVHNRLISYMKQIILYSFFCLLAFAAKGQQLPNFTIIDSPGQLKFADKQITDDDGWTHFYNSARNELLLSIHKGAANIGSLEKGMKVTAGLLGSYSKQGQDLTDADYVEDKHRWFVMNRYFRIENAERIDTTLRLRFYFSQKDIDDINTSIQHLEEKAKKQEDLQFFTVSDIRVHPLSENIIKKKGKFRIFHPPGGAAPTCKFGNFKGWKYVELRVPSLQVSGGGGKMIKPFNGKYNANGFVKTQLGKPLEGVEIVESDLVLATTDANGYYQIQGLEEKKDYKFSPRLKKNGVLGVSVLDMVYLQNGLRKKRLLKDPWLQIAADANYSESLTNSDLIKMRDAILHQDTLFTGKGGWQFVTQGYEPPRNPFKSGLPSTYVVNNLSSDLENVNFVGIKVGDVAEQKDFPNKPKLDINPTFELTEVVGCGAGDTVSVDLRVTEFRRVMGFQFSMSWDEDLLQFIGATDFNLSGLDKNSFTYRYRNEGKLAVAWLTPSPRGTSIKDETIICRLQFVVNGKDGDFTRIEFSEYPAHFEVIRENLSAGNTLLTVGGVAIENKSTLEIEDIVTQDITCMGERNGAIGLKVKGGSGKYGYHWSNGSTTPQIDKLRKGKYNVTIYDSESCPYVSDMIEIKEPNPLQLSNSDVKPMSCPGENDGKIELRVIGGTEPYQYQWSHGPQKRNLKNLSFGSYTVTISDAAGCKLERTFDIANPGEVVVGLSVSNESDMGSNDGSIRVNNVMGGTPPFSYKWSNGEKSEGIMNLVAGQYNLTVKDSKGCLNEFPITLENLNGKATDKFDIIPQKESIRVGQPAFIRIISPKDQRATVKLFNSKSKQIYSVILNLLRGENTIYLTAPEEAGTYLLQVLPLEGGVQSLRIVVK